MKKDTIDLLDAFTDGILLAVAVVLAVELLLRFF